MKILNELKPDTPYNKLKLIYQVKGHKVAIALKKKTTIAYLDVAVDEATGCELSDSVSGEEFDCIQGISLKGTEIKFTGGDELVVMDSIGDGSFILHPFRGKHSTVYVTFEIYDPDGNIGDRVVEVV